MKMILRKLLLNWHTFRKQHILPICAESCHGNGWGGECLKTATFFSFYCKDHKERKKWVKKEDDQTGQSTKATTNLGAPSNVSGGQQINQQSLSVLASNDQLKEYWDEQDSDGSSFHCPGCGALMKVDCDLIEDTIYCGDCGFVYSVPCGTLDKENPLNPFIIVDRTKL